MAPAAMSRARAVLAEVRRLAPGLAVVVCVGIAARLVHGALPSGPGKVLGEGVVAVLGGLAIGNVLRLPAATSAGVRFAFHTLLRTAIVLLGATLSFRTVAATGGRSVAVVLGLMALALTIAHLLGRFLGISGRLATLVGVGTAVCGNTAISAAAPVVRATDDEVAFAIGVNTLLGTLAVLVYPLLGHALGTTQAELGTWVGLAVNDTSQVIATGFAFGDEAGRVATVVKLTRNALMGVVLVGLSLAYGTGGGNLGLWGKVRQSVPGFVVGFLGMAALASLGVFAHMEAATGVDLAAACQSGARTLILFALAGVGLNTKLSTMRRLGLRPLYVGVAAALGTSLAAFAWAMHGTVAPP